MWNKKHRDLKSAWDTIALYVNNNESFSDLLSSQIVKNRFGSDHINATSPQTTDRIALVDQCKLLFDQLKSNGARTAYQALAFRKF